MFRSVGVMAVVMVANAGCTICTTIACTDQVNATLPPGFEVPQGADLKVKLCVDADCLEVPMTASSGEWTGQPPSGVSAFIQYTEASKQLSWMRDGLGKPGSASISVRFTNGGDVLFEQTKPGTFTKLTPNGPQCGGQCQSATVTF